MYPKATRDMSATMSDTSAPWAAHARLNVHNTAVIIGGLLTAAVFAQLFRTYWRLRHIPGPFLAKFTNFQRVYWVTTGKAHEIHQQVHDKYGDFVRFGPGMVSICDPAAIPAVYPMRPGFPKVSATK